MKLSNARLILAREIRDQLRDRRTVFMIVVLPLVLYPLLGLSMFQVSQFMQDQPTRILVVGLKDLDSKPPLFEKGRFAPSLFSNPKQNALLELQFSETDPAASGIRDQATKAVQAGEYEAAIYFPPGFSDQLAAFRELIHRRAEQRAAGQTNDELKKRLDVPSPEIIYSTANDKSQLAFVRLSDVLRRWGDRIGDENLEVSGVPKMATRPFLVDTADVADTEHRGASMWSKVLPIMLLLWALTGAFYPAVDLCAGEKERGTLETLLCSPAMRTEIVLGKLGTIMVFSIATAVLNLLSVGATSWMIMAQMPELTMPPATALVVMGVALIPISALFGSLCLALASFARSTKEGQYYLMPLLLVTMPLVVLPMSPSVDLNLGTSLIPVTGLVLLLRNVIEGSYWQAFQYSPAVIGVTLASCLMAMRWAVEQFNSEAVLFRESERFSLGLWLRHLYIDRQATPSTAAAICCGFGILVINFFMSFSLKMPEGLLGFARTLLTTQLGVIALPALLMTLLLTRSPRQTLLLKLPTWRAIPAAALLAVALHPAAQVLQACVQELYPVGDSVLPSLEKMQHIFLTANFWVLVLLIAVTPAICEELAFRGFILSGLSQMGHRWRAIVISAIFFGVTHGILQQSLIASLLGVVLAFLAVESGSILPGMVYHVIHNTLAVANGRITPDIFPHSSMLRAFVVSGGERGCEFTWSAIIISTLVGVLILMWFARLGSPNSQENNLEGNESPVQKLPLVTDVAV